MEAGVTVMAFHWNGAMCLGTSYSPLQTLVFFNYITESSICATEHIVGPRELSAIVYRKCFTRSCGN